MAIVADKPQKYKSVECKNCGELKPHTEEYFYKGGRNKDVLRRVCKKCFNEKTKENRENRKKEDPEKFRTRENVRIRVWRSENRSRDRENHRRWRLNNPENVKINKKKSYSKHRDGILSDKRLRHIRDSYGVTKEEYITTYNSQRGLCDICGVEKYNSLCETTIERSDRNVLVVDHDRVSGKIRSLLCGSCNLMIGNFKHDPDLILRAINYITGFYDTEIEYDRVKFSYKPNADKIRDYLLTLQDDVCFTCGENPEWKNYHTGEMVRRLYIDHNRRTNKVRRLLCRYCNSGIGYHDENVYVMKKAITYLEYWETKHSEDN